MGLYTGGARLRISCPTSCQAGSAEPEEEQKADGISESDLLTSQLRDYTESTHRSQTESHEPPRALSKSLPTRNTAAQSAPPNGKCRQSNGQSNKQAATSPVLKYMMTERIQIRSGRPGPNKHSIVGSNADRYNRPKPGLVECWCDVSYSTTRMFLPLAVVVARSKGTNAGCCHDDIFQSTDQLFDGRLRSTTATADHH